MAVKHNVIKKVFECDHCKQKFGLPAELRKHKQEKHPVEPFQELQNDTNTVVTHVSQSDNVTQMSQKSDPLQENDTKKCDISVMDTFTRPRHYNTTVTLVSRGTSMRDTYRDTDLDMSQNTIPMGDTFDTFEEFNMSHNVNDDTLMDIDESVKSEIVSHVSDSVTEEVTLETVTFSDFLDDTIKETIGENLFSEVSQNENKSVTQKCDTMITEKLLMCYVCGHGNKPREEIKQHVKSHYSKIKPFMYGEPRVSQCVKCHITFKTLVAKQHHECGQVPDIWTAGDADKVTKCDFCDTTFENYHTYLKHYVEYHSNTKVLRCVYCLDFECVSQAVLECHVKRHQLKPVTLVTENEKLPVNETVTENVSQLDEHKYCAKTMYQCYLCPDYTTIDKDR